MLTDNFSWVIKGYPKSTAIAPTGSEFLLIFSLIVELEILILSILIKVKLSLIVPLFFDFGGRKSGCGAGALVVSSIQYTGNLI